MNIKYLGSVISCQDLKLNYKLSKQFNRDSRLEKNGCYQGLQILLMSGVSVTSASQQLKSFWNIWSQVSDFLARGPAWHVYTIVRDTRSSCGGPLAWKAQIHDGGHRVNFDRNLPDPLPVLSCSIIL